MKKSALKLVLPLLLALASGGCGTLIALSDNQHYPNQIYAGTRVGLSGQAAQIDMPFSLIADTVLLPYTLPRTAYNYSVMRKCPKDQPDADISNCRR